MKSRITPIQIGILVLGLATAAIHFTLLFPDALFIMNSLGYLTFLGLYFLPIGLFQKYHKLVRWGFIGFTLVTILAWIVMGDKGWWLGWATKGIEVVLIALLFVDGRQET
jgi:hypothetical protein